MDEQEIVCQMVCLQSPGKDGGQKGALPLWLVATAGGTAVIFVLGIFFYGSYTGIGNAG